MKKNAPQIIRVIGNDAVHPGVIDFDDDSETASFLFDLLNVIVDEMITKPKKIDEIYSRLPQSTLDAVEKRDKDI